MRDTLKKIYQSLSSFQGKGEFNKSNISELFPRVGFLSFDEFNELKNNINIDIANVAIYEQALTHRSFTHINKSKKIKSNERLEFFGDAILDFVMSEHLFVLNREDEEGDLTKLRSNLVNGNTLAFCGRQLGLVKFIRMSYHVEKLVQANDNDSIIADVVEALIAAIYFDCGIKEANKFIIKVLLPIAIEHGLNNTENYKSLLMEYVQAKGLTYPIYKVIEETGPSHDKVFIIGVYSKDELLAKGTGKSKKIAEKNAAEAGLRILQESE